MKLLFCVIDIRRKWVFIVGLDRILLLCFLLLTFWCMCFLFEFVFSLCFVLILNVFNYIFRLPLSSMASWIKRRAEERRYSIIASVIIPSLIYFIKPAFFQTNYSQFYGRPSKFVLVYALHSLEYVLGLARFRVFVPNIYIYIWSPFIKLQ